MLETLYFSITQRARNSSRLLFWPVSSLFCRRIIIIYCMCRCRLDEFRCYWPFTGQTQSSTISLQINCNAWKKPKPIISSCNHWNVWGIGTPLTTIPILLQRRNAYLCISVLVEISHGIWTISFTIFCEKNLQSLHFEFL